MKYYIEDIRAGDSLSFLFFEFESRSRAIRNYPLLAHLCMTCHLCLILGLMNFVMQSPCVLAT